METTHGLTYSVARVIEVTAWQSVDAVFHCYLAVDPVTGLLSWLQRWELPVAHGKRWLHLSMLSPQPTACAGPACVQHAL